MFNLIRVAFVFLASFVTVFAQEETSSPVQSPVPGVEDLATIKTILTECGLSKLRVEDVSLSENERVVYLDLSNKDFSSDGIKVLPAAIGDLSELRTLILKNNKIKSLPPELFKLKKLQKLDLASNAVGDFPTWFSDLENLDSLDMRYNGITTLPPEVSKLRNLSYLQLWGNKLVEIPTSIVLLPRLTDLYLKENRLTQLPDGLVAMKTLTYFDVQGNFLCQVSPKINAWLKEKDKQYRAHQKCR